jgi:hypothetical protein
MKAVHESVGCLPDSEKDGEPQRAKGNGQTDDGAKTDKQDGADCWFPAQFAVNEVGCCREMLVSLRAKLGLDTGVSHRRD